jgi:hypothetical protein
MNCPADMAVLHPSTEVGQEAAEVLRRYATPDHPHVGELTIGLMELGMVVPVETGVRELDPPMTNVELCGSISRRTTQAELLR